MPLPLEEFKTLSAAVLKKYNEAKSIAAPKTLDPVFVTSDHSDVSLANLAKAFSVQLEKAKQDGIQLMIGTLQLFEIPNISDDCQAYAGRGYSNDSCNEFSKWDEDGLTFFLMSDLKDANPIKNRLYLEKSDGHINYKILANNDKLYTGKITLPASSLPFISGKTATSFTPFREKILEGLQKEIEPDQLMSLRWIKLDNKEDFSCREGFEKVYVYWSHFARQWGDGTTLYKAGHVLGGATPVYRCIDPNHPFIIKPYGPVLAVYIRPYQDKDVPIPRFRFQSICLGQKIRKSEYSFSPNFNGLDWLSYYNDAKSKQILPNQPKQKQTSTSLTSLSAPYPSDSFPQLNNNAASTGVTITPSPSSSSSERKAQLPKKRKATSEAMEGLAPPPPKHPKSPSLLSCSSMFDTMPKEKIPTYWDRYKELGHISKEMKITALTEVQKKILNSSHMNFFITTSGKLKLPFETVFNLSEQEFNAIISNYSKIRSGKG